MSDTFLKIPFLLFLSLFALRTLLYQWASSKSCFKKKQSAAFQYYRLLQNHVFISQKEFFKMYYTSAAVSCRSPAPRSTSMSSGRNSLSSFCWKKKGGQGVGQSALLEEAPSDLHLLRLVFRGGCPGSGEKPDSHPDFHSQWEQSQGSVSLGTPKRNFWKKPPKFTLSPNYSLPLHQG